MSTAQTSQADHGGRPGDVRLWELRQRGSPWSQRGTDGARELALQVGCLPAPLGAALEVPMLPCWGGPASPQAAGPERCHSLGLTFYASLCRDSHWEGPLLEEGAPSAGQLMGGASLSPRRVPQG